MYIVIGMPLASEDCQPYTGPAGLTPELAVEGWYKRACANIGAAPAAHPGSAEHEALIDVAHELKTSPVDTAVRLGDEETLIVARVELPSFSGEGSYSGDLDKPYAVRHEGVAIAHVRGDSFEAPRVAAMIAAALNGYGPAMPAPEPTSERKLLSVRGEHPTIPGRREKLFVSAARAAACAHDMVSTIARDLDAYDPIAAGNDWEAMLAELKDRTGRDDFDVWIDELAIADQPELPAALEDVLNCGDVAVQRLADGADLHSVEEDAANDLAQALATLRLAAIWRSSYVEIPVLTVSPPCETFTKGGARD